MNNEDRLIFTLMNNIQIEVILEILIKNGLITKEEFDKLCEEKADAL